MQAGRNWVARPAILQAVEIRVLEGADREDVDLA
jgi:hypothetical protein